MTEATPPAPSDATGGPADTTAVISWAKLEAAGALTASRRQALDLVVAAVNWLVVNRWQLVPVGTEATPNIVLGSVMLAGRWFARGDTPAGVIAGGDNGPAYVRTSDPDVAVLLGIGPSRKPALL